MRSDQLGREVVRHLSSCVLPVGHRRTRGADLRCSHMRWADNSGCGARWRFDGLHDVFAGIPAT
jgi:hypothetical protein